VKEWTGCSLPELVRLAEDRSRYRKLVHTISNARQRVSHTHHLSNHNCMITATFRYICFLLYSIDFRVDEDDDNYTKCKTVAYVGNFFIKYCLISCLIRALTFAFARHWPLRQSWFPLKRLKAVDVTSFGCFWGNCRSLQFRNNKLHHLPRKYKNHKKRKLKKLVTTVLRNLLVYNEW